MWSSSERMPVLPVILSETQTSSGKKEFAAQVIGRMQV
jgi:hypothetical protein